LIFPSAINWHSPVSGSAHVKKEMNCMKMRIDGIDQEVLKAE
jgi:hypothetical protein